MDLGPDLARDFFNGRNMMFSRRARTVVDSERLGILFITSENLW